MFYNQATIDEVKTRLVNAYHPLSIYLFGSYAWGSPDPESDLDLLVVVNQSDEKKYKRTRKGLESLRGLKINKDLLVYTLDEFNNRSAHVSTLCYKIKKEGKQIYGIT